MSIGKMGKIQSRITSYNVCYTKLLRETFGYKKLELEGAVAPIIPVMSKSPHILVVDDDREIRSLVAQLLRKHGFRVTDAADGREMTQAMEAGRYDLVVLDLMLPGEDGLSLCRRVRATSSMPIIMLTAMGEDTDRIVGLEMSYNFV